MLRVAQARVRNTFCARHGNSVLVMCEGRGAARNLKPKTAKLNLLRKTARIGFDDLDQGVSPKMTALKLGDSASNSGNPAAEFSKIKR